ncbi:MAG: threonine--tRNA ligase [Lachnospiraceae bacterium]|nr:threonine--tRNA ligase [Lachnospiraceae bacterium]
MKVLLKNGNVVEESFESAEGKKAFWHTSAHVLAQAVKRLYPNVKCGIGPAIEKGFYYDFEFDFPFSEENLGAVEDEMRKIIKESLSLQVYEVSKEEALKYMADNNEPYKQELIRELPAEEKISFYKQGDYAEFCAGPHIINTSHIKAVKLLSVAGAYWRGNEKNNVLTRIYGISFPKASELEEYLKLLEEAKRRDHRKLGKDLGLFLLMDEGPGFPFFLPKGLVLKNTLIEYWRQVHKRYGYVEISTPIILNRDLWERSGHWTHYKDKMYTTVIDDMDYAIKPMNCPGGMLVYRSEQHSYRELPLRVGELGLVHRHELSGTLHGLFRVRCFTQDDAHIFMTREQMREEIKNVIRLFDEVYSVFGLSYEIEVSTMPEDHMGDIETWDFATDTLKAACEDMGKSYVINEGDGAFYGPKLDFHLSDSLGRTWQCGTIQLDMQLPERFELEYVGADGKKHRPIMIHRVVFGSIERFIGIITEHFAGAFPLWIAPVQVEVLPVTDRAAEYAGGIVNKLQAAGFRAEADYRPEKLGYKIREAVGMKVPYMVIVGDKDIENRTISVRHRSGKDLGAMKYEDFESLIKEENDKKSL